MENCLRIGILASVYAAGVRFMVGGKRRSFALIFGVREPSKRRWRVSHKRVMLDESAIS